MLFPLKDNDNLIKDKKNTDIEKAGNITRGRQQLEQSRHGCNLQKLQKAGSKSNRTHL